MHAVKQNKDKHAKKGVFWLKLWGCGTVELIAREFCCTKASFFFTISEAGRNKTKLYPGIWKERRTAQLDLDLWRLCQARTKVTSGNISSNFSLRLTQSTFPLPLYLSLVFSTSSDFLSFSFENSITQCSGPQKIALENIHKILKFIVQHTK